MRQARRALVFLLCIHAILVSAKDRDEIEGSGDGSGELPESIAKAIAPNLTLLNAANELEENATTVPESTSTSTTSTTSTTPKPTPKPSSVGDCPPKMDVVFLLDTSGSIEQIYEEHVKWTVALVNSLPIEKDAVRVAAVQYAGFPLTEFALGTYPSAQDIRQHLEQIHFQSGVTRTGYALRKAEAELFQENRGARADAAKVIVLFTDGLSIDDPLKPAHQLRDIKGVKIYVVSVGSDGFEPEMNRIAGEKDNVFGPSELSRLRAALLRDTERTRACSRIGKLPNQVLRPASTLADVQKFAKFPIEQAAVAQAQVDKIPVRRGKQLLNNADSSETRDDQLINLTPKPRRQGFTRSTTTTTTTAPSTTPTSRTTRRFRSRSSTTPETTFATTEKSRLNKPRKEKSSSSAPSTIEQTTRRLTTTSRRSTTRDSSSSPSSSSSVITTARTPIPFRTTPFRSLQRDPPHSVADVACPMDILFVVDSSGSVQRVYEEQKEYLNEILAEIEPGEQRHRVALVQFSGSNHQKTEWSYDAFDDNSALMHAFQAVRHFTGTTYIGAALQSARAVLDTRRRNVPSVVILLSDGFSQDDATEQAKFIRNLPNVEFIALSVSELSNAQYLSELTDDPSRVYVGEKKESLRQKLVNKLRCK